MVHRRQQVDGAAVAVGWLGAPVRQAGLAEDLKVLSDYRDELLALRHADGNRLHADLAIVCPGYGQVCRRLTAERSLAAAEQLLADQPSVRTRLARRRIRAAPRARR